MKTTPPASVVFVDVASLLADSAAAAAADDDDTLADVEDFEDAEKAIVNIPASMSTLTVKRIASTNRKFWCAVDRCDRVFIIVLTGDVLFSLS